MATITIRLPDEEKEKLIEIAEEQDLTLSWVVRKALKEYLEE